jgi:hypothetical protein
LLLFADPLSVKNTHLMEEARFSKTMKGRPALYDKDGHRYVKNRSTAKAIYWKCQYSMPHAGKCPGNCITDGFFIKMKSGKHIHEPNEPVIKSKKQKTIPRTPTI